MKLTSKEAIQMLEQERNKTSNERWINHSICVGNVAGKIAKALDLDEDFAKTLGYIHDIGKRYDYIESGVFPHAMKGYDYIKSYFDDLLGYNLYDLFPEIKENL